MSTDGTPSGTLERLTDKQAAFVHHYLANGGNASAAARAAGYAHGSSGRKLIRRGTIQNAIEQARERQDAHATAREAIGALARVSGERIVDELAATAFSEPVEPPSHSEKIRALDILAKIQGLYNDNPVYVQVRQYVQSLPPEEKRELLLDRGRLVELLEGQGFRVEAA